MITFLWAKLLWLLLGVPLLVGAYVGLLRRSRRTVRYSSVALVREAMNGTQRVRRHLPAALLLLSFVVLMLCMARPTADLSFLMDQRTIILAIDTSTSMSAADIAPTRIEAAQAAAKSFVAGLPRGIRVGIVSFADHADVVQIPTRNRGYLADAIGRLELDYGTAVGSGLIASLVCLFPEQGIDVNYDVFGWGIWRDGGRAVPMPVAAGAAPAPGTSPAKFGKVAAGSNTTSAIVLLTDGRTTTGLAPRAVAKLAADRGVRVFTVGFGTDRGTIRTEDGATVEAPLDEEALKGVAEVTGGAYFHADSAEGLERAYRALTPYLDLERNRETEMTALFALAAATLLVASAGLSMYWTGPVA